MTDGEVLAVPLCLLSRLPVVICRDFPYAMHDPLEFVQKTAYFSRLMYFGRPSRPLRVCIVDAIIATGATICTAAAQALRTANCVVTGVVSAVAKAHHDGPGVIEEQVGIEPRSVFTIRYGTDGPFENLEDLRWRPCSR